MKKKCQNCNKIFEAPKNRIWCNECNIKAMLGGLTNRLNKIVKKELK